LIEGKKKIITDLYDKKKRIDNRERYDSFREVSIKTGISVNAEGSAQARIGRTEVLAGVKIEVGEPYPDTPDEGVLIVTAEFSPIASPGFEPGPPKEDAIELARVVDRVIRESRCIDMKKLCIKKKEKVYIIFLDLYMRNHDGNLIDTATLAAIAAINTARLPKLNKDKEVVYGELTNKKLPLTKKPTNCTIIKIGNHLLVDPCLQEEEVADARITIGSWRDSIHAIQKGWKSGFTLEELRTCVSVALKQNKELQKHIK